jgi:hypothetical protein
MFALEMFRSRAKTWRSAGSIPLILRRAFLHPSLSKVLGRGTETRTRRLPRRALPMNANAYRELSGARLSGRVRSKRYRFPRIRRLFVGLASWGAPIGSQEEFLEVINGHPGAWQTPSPYLCEAFHLGCKEFDEDARFGWQQPGWHQREHWNRIEIPRWQDSD